MATDNNLGNQPETEAGTASPTHLKTVVERSLAMLGEDAQPEEQPRRNWLPLHCDASNLQKRVLDDAAQALSKLWKATKPTRVNFQRPGTERRRSTT